MAGGVKCAGALRPSVCRMEKKTPRVKSLNMNKVRSQGSGPGRRLYSSKASQMRSNQSRAFNVFSLSCVRASSGWDVVRHVNVTPPQGDRMSTRAYRGERACAAPCSPTCPHPSSREGVGFTVLPSGCTLMMDSTASPFHTGFCLQIASEAENKKADVGRCRALHFCSR